MKTFTQMTCAALLLAAGLALSAPADALAQKSTKNRYAATNRGAKITSVLAGWPAADAGLESGDVITRIDGVQISSLNHLSNALAGKSSVTMSVVNVRTGETITVTAYPSGGKLGITTEIVDVGDSPTIYGSRKSNQMQKRKR